MLQLLADELAWIAQQGDWLGILVRGVWGYALGCALGEWYFRRTYNRR